MDWILDDLAVSSARSAREKGEKFDTVVSMASPPECSTHQFVIKDGEHDYRKFEDAVDCVIDALERDDEVLVHCNAGISRSVSVCIAVCCVYSDDKYGDAYDKCRRGFSNPSSNLLDSVIRYVNKNTDRDLNFDRIRRN